MKYLLALTLGAVLLSGQTPQPGTVVPAIFPPPVVSFNEVKAYLGLSDAQIEQLRQILFDRDNGTQAIAEQIRVRQEQISSLLAGGSNDAAQIGRLSIEVHNLQKQFNAPDDEYRQRALAVLTQEQRVKLGQLEQILKQSPAAYQAVQLLLLSPLPPSPPVILGIPAGISARP